MDSEELGTYSAPEDEAPAMEEHDFNPGAGDDAPAMEEHDREGQMTTEQVCWQDSITHINNVKIRVINWICFPTLGIRWFAKNLNACQHVDALSRISRAWQEITIFL